MYKQGDILLIPIPFSDLTSNKKRPVLVISNNLYNSKADDIVVAAITSNVKIKEYTVLFTEKDLQEGDLEVDSCIRADKIYSLSQDIIRKFGAVNSEIMEAVKRKIYMLISDNKVI